MQRTETAAQAKRNVNAGRIVASVWPQWLTNPTLLPLIKEMRSCTRGCSTVLDVGCGNSSPLRYLPDVHLVGIDGYPPAVEEARDLRTHDELLVGNVLRLADLFADRRFDCCFAMDVIEHLKKEDGWRMLEDMERLATRYVVIFTPNGFVPQRSKDGDLQEHLSGWVPEKMRQRGYRVI